MNNLEILCCEVQEIKRHETGNINRGIVNERVCCFWTDRNHLYFYEDLINHTNPVGENIREVRYLQYLSIHQVLFITNDFDLIIYNGNSKEFVVVYSSPIKIESVAWNPSETFLILCDTEENLYGLTFECNIGFKEYRFIETCKSNLHDPVPNSVYVGWGSHNTQFKGSKKIIDEEIQEIPQQYSPPIISWRGNGEQFVINFWKEERRYLKLFDSTLRPLYQSESYPNLLALTSFKQQGNFIACATIHNNQNKIVIFEKNCLVKSEFLVPEVKGVIRNILYHPFLHILAIYSLEEAGNGYINIFVNSNAKWYLKQQLLYVTEKQVKCLNWADSLENSICKLNILTSSSIERIVFRMVINRSPNNGTVAVVDGSIVHFTFFDSEIVPPPMSSAFLKFDKPINRIQFHPNLPQCILTDSTSNVKLLNFKNNTLSEILEDDLVDKNFKPETFIPNYLSFNDVTEIMEPINLNDRDTASLVYCTGCKINDNFYEFALNRSQDLLINRNVMCSKVSSVFIYKSYLLFIHVSCKLYCVRLTSDIVHESSWELKDFYFRDVEQGAKIVCVNSRPEIVLELPRGNLETIKCRLISIDMVEEMLSDGKWQEAVNLIRLHKLNWNLLIDLNPQRFGENIPKFIKAAETVSMLNSIVSEFGTSNCLTTMYSQCVKDRTFPVQNKTNKLLQILNYIIDLDPIANLISIVTLQIKHFTLKSALKSVYKVYELNHLEMCKKAIFQILLYCQTPAVINMSFTLYNIEFVRFVHICCSEDPKVFEPQLDKLKGLGTVDLRFQMNVLAKNYKGAVKFLIRCSNYQENYIRKFITKHNTYEEAYKSVTPKNPNFTLCSRLFATYLSMKQRYNEAGLILQKAGLYQDAIIEYKKSLNWRQVIGLLALLKIDTATSKQIISELAGGLVDQKQIDEAVLLYEIYCEDYLKAISVLLNKAMFQKALCMVRKYNRLDLIETEIQPAIIKYRSELYDKITALGEQFSMYCTRLLTVRHNKLLKLKNRYKNEVSDVLGDEDIYSEYGSVISSRGSTLGSNKSKISTVSSKNRRKLKKKKIDLREGGVFEDIALIRQLYLLTVTIFECGEEVREICLTLTDDLSFDFCKMLHKNLENVQEKVKLNIPEIWSDTFVNASESTEPEILAVVQNREELDMEFRTPPLQDKLDETWKLLIFQ